jgi:hypothetical protein
MNRVNWAIGLKIKGRNCFTVDIALFCLFLNLSLSKKGDTEGFLSGKQTLSAVLIGV